jgi:hypothetical protein
LHGMNLVEKQYGCECTPFDIFLLISLNTF